MDYEFVIDTYAWVEYFRGSKEGAVAKEYIETKICATSAVTIAELSEKYKKEDKSFDKDFDFIVATTKIISVNAEIAISAGHINVENKKSIKNWGMADSLILATAKLLNSKVVTGDEHFKNLSEAVMLN